MFSLNLFPEFVAKTHLPKTPFPRQDLSLSHLPTLSPRMSIASNPYPPHRNRLCSGLSHNLKVGRVLTTESVAPLHSNCTLSFLAPLEAILFDIDGTLCDSDPLHFQAFYEMLQEVGFNGGAPITEEFFMEKIHGKHNDQLCSILFPDWDFEKAINFMDDKEAMFRSLVAKDLQPVNGLNKLCKWIEERSLKRAAVTNAPRPNAELLISMLGLADFFEIVILGSECEKAKPFPDPYLKGLQALEVSPKHTFAFEDSVSGIKAAIAAGMPVVGLATRNPEKLLAEAGAVFVIGDFDDPKLWAALEELDNKAEVTTGTT